MDREEMSAMMTARGVERRAIAHYGPAHQLVKLQEELGELIQAIAKLQNAADAEEAQARAEHVLEEAADVSIMLDQLKLILPFGTSRMDAWKKSKISRLSERLGKAEEAGPCNTTDS